MSAVEISADSASHKRKDTETSIESAMPEPHPPALDVPPNGGLMAWLQVLCAFMCNFNTWGVVNSFGEFQAFYQSDLLRQHSPFQISWIGCLTAALSFCGTMCFGYFIDKGYQRELLIAAGIIQVASLMGLAECKTYIQVIMCQGLCYGLAASMAFLVGMASVAPWFSTKRPIAMGLAVLGSSVGGSIYSSAVRKLLPEVGFPWTVRIMAFIVLATCAVPPIFTKARLPPRKDRDYIAWEVFQEPVFMIFCLSGMLAFSGFYQFYFYYQTWAEEVVPSSTVIPYITAVMNATSSVGRVVPSYMVMFMGPFNVFVGCLTFSTALSFAWIGANSRASVFAVGIIFSIVSGPITATPPTIVPVLTTNLNRLGIRLSFAFFALGLGVFLGAPFTGMIIRKYGWVYGQVYCGVSWGAALILFLIARQIKSKGKIWAKI